MSKYTLVIKEDSGKKVTLETEDWADVSVFAEAYEDMDK